MWDLKKDFIMQLDFLEEMTEYKMLSQQVSQMIEMHHKLRKSVFAQLNDHDKIFVKLQEQIDYLRQAQVVQIK